MLFRPILSRICKHQRFANFCILKNGGPSLVSPENGSSPSTLKEKSQEKGYVISYLVHSCGLSQENAISASKKVHFDGPDKPNAVLNFFEKQGFSKTQIAEIIRKQPQLLLSNPEKHLSPKIEFFLQLTGIFETDILRIVSTYPHVLTKSLGHRFATVYDYLKETIGAEKVATLLKRGSWVFYVDLENRLIPNVDFLKELGVPRHCIQSSLLNFPEIFWPQHVEFRQIVGEVKQLGFDPSNSMSKFILAIHARTGKRNIALWDRCYEIYSKWGWSKDDIHMAFGKHPSCMLMSEKKISTTLDFLVNKIGRESRSVARNPQVLFFNIEKRIVPRCSIVHLLSLKGLVKKDWSLTSVLCATEKDFLARYVTRYTEKLPELYNVYLSRKQGSWEPKSGADG